MNSHKKDTNKSLKFLNLTEHIRLRPGMYIGGLDCSGLIIIFKGLICEIHEEFDLEHITFYFDEKEGVSKGRIILKGSFPSLLIDWLDFKNSFPNSWIIRSLTALSSNAQITYKKEDQNILKQKFTKGQTQAKPQKISCDQIEIAYELDEEIWEGRVNGTIQFYLNHLQELSYLCKDLKIKVHYPVDGEQCSVIFHSTKGLQEKLELFHLMGLIDSYGDWYFEKEIQGFVIDCAFSITYQYINPTTIKSYAYYEWTHLGGSHEFALIKGIKKGIETYIEKWHLTQNHKVNYNWVKENTLGFIHVKSGPLRYAGATKAKLDNRELVEPLADYISGLVVQKMEKNKDLVNWILRDNEIIAE